MGEVELNSKQHVYTARELDWTIYHQSLAHMQACFITAAGVCRVFVLRCLPYSTAHLETINEL
jgi:hypothetical protein